jgi:hypothetical protein
MDNRLNKEPFLIFMADPTPPAGKVIVPCPNKAKGLCAGKDLNKTCSHGLCRQCCLAASKVEYDRRLAASEQHPKKKWCRVSAHNYEPVPFSSSSLSTGSAVSMLSLSQSGPLSLPSSLSDSTSVSVSAEPASTSSPASGTVNYNSSSGSSLLPSSQSTTKKSVVHAMPAPIPWQEVPANAIPQHLERNSQVLEASQRKSAMIRANSHRKMTSVCFVIWSKVSSAAHRSCCY